MHRNKGLHICKTLGKTYKNDVITANSKQVLENMKLVYVTWTCVVCFDCFFKISFHLFMQREWIQKVTYYSGLSTSQIPRHKVKGLVFPRWITQSETSDFNNKNDELIISILLNAVHSSFLGVMCVIVALNMFIFRDFTRLIVENTI